MAELLTRKEIAARFGLSERQIHNLVEEGMPRRVRGRTVRYPWEDCRDWYIKFKQQEAVRRARSDDPADLDDARARKMGAEAALAELELAKAEGEVITREEFDATVGVLLDRLRAKLLNMPGKWAPLTVGKAKVAETVAVWQQAVEEALATLSAAGDDLDEESDGDQAAA